jgi:biopolymer transport protein ExbD
MAIRYHCPQCGQYLSIASRLAGHTTTCPACKADHVVPAADEPKLAAPAPAGASLLSPSAEPKEAKPPEKEIAAPATSKLPEGPSFPVSYKVDPLDDDDDEEALVLGRIERKSDELDLIPMVDCVFLLLVFYMITATYAMQKTIEMGRPAAEKKGALQSVQAADDTAQSSIIVQIDAQNRVSVDDVPLASVTVLVDVLRSKMNGDQKNDLVVEADPRAFNETIVAVVDAAHDLQFQHVRMAMTAGEND